MTAPARPAPALRSVAALTALELRLTARRGENLLVTLVIPVAVLLFFGGTSLLPVTGDRIRALVPGSMALGIIAAGFVSLGIATAYERSYGVLKRLGAAPIPRWAFIASKFLSVLAIELLQVLVLAVVAILAFGWAPDASWRPLGFVLAVLLGTATFTGLGLLLAGTLRAEAVLALANGLFLGLLMLGGVILPVDHLPGVLQPVAAQLPSAALVDLLRATLDPSSPTPGAVGHALLVLAAWAVGANGLAALRFRWD